MEWKLDSVKEDFCKNLLDKKGVKVLLDEFIGKGSHGRVYAAAQNRFNKSVVVKLIDKRDVDGVYLTKYLPQEIQLLSLLNHSNIVQFFETFETDHFAAMVQERALNGSVQNLLDKQKQSKLAVEESKFLFRQLIEALMYLETISVIHRDINCDNLFLDECNNVKLGDFGMARMLSSAQTSNSFCGTEAYMALEVLQGKDYRGNASDIWSAGITLFRMRTGGYPFAGIKRAEVIRNQQSQFIRFPSDVTDHERELLIQTLHPSTSLRATCKEIISSKWLSDTQYFMRDKTIRSAVAISNQSVQPTTATNYLDELLLSTCIDPNEDADDK